MTIYDFEMKNVRGETIPLSKFKNKVVLVVNTASECGFTPQYEGLQSLYEKFNERGLVILGFPCNQFGGQEPGTETEIKNFCEQNYRITFPLFAKVDVNGEKAAPFYVYLKEACPGILGTEAIKWNFTKFLVDKTGKPVKRFASTTKPEEIAGEIEELLG